METKRNFKLILLLFLLIGMGSCKDEEVVPVIVGEWKLVKVQTVFHDPQVYDYTESNIIYEFKKDGKLIVSSDIDDYRGRPPGEYLYSYRSDILTVGTFEVICTISDNKLTVDDSPHDGSIYYFIRVE